MDVNDYLHVNDFAEVVSDKMIHADIKYGHVVWIASLRPMMIEENDPYTQRITFICNLFNKHTGEVDPRLFFIDPAHLKKIHGSQADHYMELLKDAHSID